MVLAVSDLDNNILAVSHARRDGVFARCRRGQARNVLRRCGRPATGRPVDDNGDGAFDVPAGVSFTTAFRFLAQPFSQGIEGTLSAFSISDRALTC
jgi:hypothetical protein